MPKHYPKIDKSRALLQVLLSSNILADDMRYGLKVALLALDVARRQGEYNGGKNDLLAVADVLDYVESCAI